MSSAQILVVEDERLVATAIRHELEQFGYQVSGIASTAQDALQQAGQSKPDLVLMDIHLKSGADGIQAAREIHDRYGIPVVYLSAFSDPEMISRASHTEAFGYLLKPYEERELHTTIEMAITKHRAEVTRRELQRLRRQSELRRQRAQRIEVVSRLAGGLARPLNNLLTSILTNTSLALTQFPDDSEPKALLQQVEVASQRAAELVQRLLVFSSLTGRPAEPPHEVDLNLLFPEFLKEIDARHDSQIKIAYRPRADLWTLVADEVLLAHALLELALNSRDAAPRERTLSFAAENISIEEHDLASHPAGRAGDFVRIHITDTGNRPNRPPRAHSADSATTTNPSGPVVDLGMALITAIAEQQQGWFECTSATKQSMQFELYLPRFEPLDSDPGHNT